jgi:two-component system cell cycle response regulator
MTRRYMVALCGLSPKDARLVEIVLSRPMPGSSRRFAPLSGADAARADIAVIDLSSPHGESFHQRLREANPGIVPVYVSEHGTGGNSRYRIPARALLLQLQRVLELVATEALESSKVHAHPTSGSATPANPANPANPAAAAAASPGALYDPGRPAAGGDRRPLAALAVDDSETVRTQLVAGLERVGIQAHAVADAEGAINAMRVQSFDLILLDVVMPGIDGYELCRRIKQDAYSRGTPVIMLTSRSSPFDRARGALAGCDSYLTKPVTWTAFSAEVDRVLARHFRNDRNLMTARGYRAGGA